MKYIYLLTLIFILLFNSISAKEADYKSVNFIIIYLDDVGYGDVSLTGAVGYTTPNIDKMAAQGMFFSHCACCTTHHHLLTNLTI